MITKEDHCNALRWRLLELQEAKMRIEQEISVAQENVNIAEDEMKAAEDEVYANFEDSGISADLYNSYLDFCESLDPEFGQRGGFSVTCNSDHENSYTNYDPEFSLFKDCIDMPYTHCNFRSEASVISPKESIGGPSEYIVEFWPIKAPEPLTGTELTWGEQYAELYKLATATVRLGSEAAMEMLIALPDMNSAFGSGWLLDYQFEDALKDNNIIGKRWIFRSAHKIDSPCTVEEKRKRLNLMLVPENIRL